MKLVCIAVVAAGFLFAAVSADSGGQQTPRDREQFRTGTTAIMVDVVVRDKQGRPVTDLAASDFELYEDDVRHSPASVSGLSACGDRVMSYAPGMSTAASATTTTIAEYTTAQRRPVDIESKC